MTTANETKFENKKQCWSVFQAVDGLAEQIRQAMPEQNDFDVNYCDNAEYTIRVFDGDSYEWETDISLYSDRENATGFAQLDYYGLQHIAALIRGHMAMVADYLAANRVVDSLPTD